ncbi:MAG: hypothetical protein LC714_03505 [Actinobacteria bacterium]|nr:hypothetical protein [Actinomycetota bacterium]
MKPGLRSISSRCSSSGRVGVLVLARRLFPVLVRDEQRFEFGWLDAQDLRERRGSGFEEIPHLCGSLFQLRRVDDGDTAVQARVAREGGTLYFGLLYGATFDSSQGAFTPPAVYTLTART